MEASAPAKTRWRYGVRNTDFDKNCILKAEFEFTHEADEDDANKVLDQFIYELRKQVKFIYHPELKQEYEAALQATTVQRETDLHSS